MTKEDLKEKEMKKTIGMRFKQFREFMACFALPRVLLCLAPKGIAGKNKKKLEKLFQIIYN